MTTEYSPSRIILNNGLWQNIDGVFTFKYTSVQITNYRKTNNPTRKKKKLQMPTADTCAQSVLTFLLWAQKLNRHWDEAVLIWTE